MEVTTLFYTTYIHIYLLFYSFYDYYYIHRHIATYIYIRLITPDVNMHFIMYQFEFYFIIQLEKKSKCASSNIEPHMPFSLFHDFMIIAFELFVPYNNTPLPYIYMHIRTTAMSIHAY